MQNIGCQTYPKHRCKFWDRAGQAFKRACDSQGEAAKKRHTWMIKYDFPQYRNTLLTFRITPPGEEPIPGVANPPGDNSERLVKVRQLAETWQVFYSIESRRSFIWLNERQFHCYQVMFEGLSKEESVLKWHKLLTNVAVPKEVDEDGVQVLPVKQPKIVSIIQAFQKGTMYKEVSDVESGDRDAALASIRQKLADNGQRELVEQLNIGCARMGASSITNAEDKPEKGKGLTQRDLEMNASLEAVLQDGGTDDDADESAIKINLTDARGHVNASVQKFVGQQYLKKTSNSALLRKLVEKLGDAHKEVVALDCVAKMATFEKVVAALRCFQKQNASWTENSYRLEFKKAVRTLQEAEALARTISENFGSLKNSHVQSVSEASGNRRRLALIVRRLLGEGILTALGYPKSCMIWLGETIFGITPETKVLDVSSVKVFKPSGSFDLAAPNLCYAPHGSGHELCSVEKLADCLRARINKGGNKLKVAIKPPQPKDDPNDEEEDNPISCMRLCPKAGDGVEDCSWVPEAFKTHGGKPLALTTFGAPLLFGARLFGFRHGPVYHPMPGIGHLLHVIEGSTLVVAWPMANTLAKKASIPECFAMLESFTSTSAAEFMGGAVFGAMEVGSTLWVPYGHHVFTIGMRDENVMLFTPMCYDGLLQSMDPEVKKQVIDWNATFIVGNKDIIGGDECRRWMSRAA